MYLLLKKFLFMKLITYVLALLLIIFKYNDKISIERRNNKDQIKSQIKSKKSNIAKQQKQASPDILNLMGSD